MSMKHFLTVLVGGLGIIVAASSFLGKSPQSEILVASSAALKPEFIELSPKTTMQTTGDWSEVFIEIPGVHAEQAGAPLLVEGEKELSLEGYVVANTGERIGLDEVEIVGFGSKRVLSLSNRVLEWKSRSYRFRSIVLKTNIQIAVGKIIWFSYNPASTHSGVAIPTSFQ
jgi:hypothetical protein